MSDSVVKCDGCGAFGRRTEDAAAPDFWFFIAADDRTKGAPHMIFVIWACSTECRDAMWKPGPARNFIDERGTFRMREKKAKVQP